MRNYPLMQILKRVIKIALRRDVLIRQQITRPKLRYGNLENDWVFCPAQLNENSVVYSFGIGQDISFDLALIEKFDLHVYAFDPTPKSSVWIANQDLHPNFHYFPVGISDHDGILDFYELLGQDMVSFTELRIKGRDNRYISTPLSVQKITSICAKLNHVSIDILKLDIEGSEYSVIPDILNSNIEIQQILVEFHHHFNGIQIEETVKAIKLLNQQGYRIFDVSPNGNEYSFILE